MKKTIFTGSGVALITPFNNERIDFDELRRLIKYQIENGTDAIILLGTTGEASTMTEDEKIETIQVAKDEIAGRIPLIVGTGGNNTASVKEYSRKVDAIGVDGLLIVTPYYNKTTQDGLFEHYKEVCMEINTPVIVYNVPSRTGINIKPVTIKKLYEEINNIVGVKEASGDISQIAEIASICDIDIYSGNDDQTIPIMSLGGKGVISVFANVMPKEMHKITRFCLDSDFLAANIIGRKYNKFMKLLFCEVNPIPVKETMNMIGFNVGIPRLPLVKLTDENKKKIEEELRTIK